MRQDLDGKSRMSLFVPSGSVNDAPNGIRKLKISREFTVSIYNWNW